MVKHITWANKDNIEHITKQNRPCVCFMIHIIHFIVNLVCPRYLNGGKSVNCRLHISRWNKSWNMWHTCCFQDSVWPLVSKIAGDCTRQSNRMLVKLKNDTIWLHNLISVADYVNYNNFVMTLSLTSQYTFQNFLDFRSRQIVGTVGNNITFKLFYIHPATEGIKIIAYQGIIWNRNLQLTEWKWGIIFVISEQHIVFNIHHPFEVK